MANIVTKEKALYYTGGANIDANYGPWSTISQYESFIHDTVGLDEIPDAVTIAIKDNTGKITKYVRQNNTWQSSGGSSDNVGYLNENIPNINNAKAALDFVIDRTSDREYDQQNPDGLGYIILDPSKTFQELVVYENTTYEVRNVFDLLNNSRDFLIPQNCVIKFNGGCIKNGKIKFQNTTLDQCQSECIGVIMSGSISNTLLLTSWIYSTSASTLTDILYSIFNLDSVVSVFVDSDITLDKTKSSEDGVKRLLLHSNGKTITDACQFKVETDISIKNVNIIRDADSEFMIHMAYDTEYATIDIDKVTFDGCGVCHSFLNSYNSSSILKYTVSVTNCDITGVTRNGIKISKDNTSTICYNNIHDFGNDVSKWSVFGIILGDDTKKQKAYSSDVSHNVIKNILVKYTVGNDTREAHGILVYGNNNKVTHNDVENIYSIVDGQKTDAGTDTEGIYLKGDNCEISYNVLIDAGGSDGKDENGVAYACDGAITLKASSYSVISNNTITTRWGKAIVADANYCTIENNHIINKERSSYGMYIYSGQMKYSNIVRNNRLECIERTFGVITKPLFFSLQEDLKCCNNTSLGYPSLFILYSIGAKKNLFQDNYFEIKNVNYFEEGVVQETAATTGNDFYDIIHVTNTDSTEYKFVNNTFALIGVQMNVNCYFAISGSDEGVRSNNFIFDNNTFIFDSIKQSGNLQYRKTSIYRFMFGVNEVLNNKFIYEDCDIYRLFYKMTKAKVIQNVFDIPSDIKLPTLSVSKGDLSVPGSVLPGLSIGNYKFGISTFGETSNRPTENEIGIGFQYFDTTINKAVTWNGEEWMEGTYVSGIESDENGKIYINGIGGYNGFNSQSSNVKDIASVLGGVNISIVSELPSNPDQNTLYLIKEA